MSQERHSVRGVVVVCLALLLGGAGLAVILTSRSAPSDPQRSTGAQPAVIAPAVPSGPASEAPSGTPGAVSPTPTKAFDTATVVASVTRSVVTVTSTVGTDDQVARTGVVLTGDGLVLVDDQVVAGASRISGKVADGRTFQAEVVGFDRTHDVAVIKLDDATGLQRIGVGNSSSVNVDDPVIAVGGSGGDGGPTGVTGSVTALNQSITAKEPGGGGSQRLDGLIQVATTMRSGGLSLLVDWSGRLIGIETAASADQDQATTGKRFVIPSNTAVGIAAQIQAGNESSTVHVGPTALLGVSTANATGQVPGAVVTGLLTGGPAQRAGIADGGVIRAVDDMDIDSVRALTAVLDMHHPGDAIRIAWVDSAGRSRTATARLAVGPPG